MQKLKTGDATTCDVCGVSGPYSDQPGEGIVHGADGHTLTCDVGATGGTCSNE